MIEPWMIYGANGYIGRLAARVAKEQRSIKAHGVDATVVAFWTLQESQEVTKVLLRVNREDLVREVEMKRFEAKRWAAHERRQIVDGVPVVDLRVLKGLDECLADFQPRLLFVRIV